MTSPKLAELKATIPARTNVMDRCSVSHARPLLEKEFKANRLGGRKLCKLRTIEWSEGWVNKLIVQSTGRQ